MPLQPRLALLWMLLSDHIAFVERVANGWKRHYFRNLCRLSLLPVNMKTNRLKLRSFSKILTVLKSVFIIICHYIAITNYINILLQKYIKPIYFVFFRLEHLILEILENTVGLIFILDFTNWLIMQLVVEITIYVCFKYYLFIHFLFSSNK